MCIRDSPLTVRSDHKSISFIQRCKLSHGRLTRWILALQEYNITWECVLGKQNTVADALSRVNLESGTFEIEREDVGRVYHVITAREELVEVLSKIQEEQSKDQSLSTIPVSYTHLDVYKRQRFSNHDHMI